MNDDFDSYGDEYDNVDEETQISETTFSRYLYRGEDGHYFFAEVSGYKLWGQDWGMTPDHQWDNHEFLLLDANRPFLWAVIRCLKHGVLRKLEPGECIDISWLDDDEYYDGECPVCEVPGTIVEERDDLWYCERCGADFSTEFGMPSASES